MSDGRVQALSWAFETRPKAAGGQRWFSLRPGERIPPGDPLHWTGVAGNWNFMCAECHSTQMKKGYDPGAGRYEKSFDRHRRRLRGLPGPGSRHVKWAELPDMARPAVKNFDLAVKTAGLESRALVELCAPCHSRRATLGNYTHSEPDLLDSMLPSLLTEGLYFADGQILEEVYVYGSYTQSKMYNRDVRCSDCHNLLHRPEAHGFCCWGSVRQRA